MPHTKKNKQIKKKLPPKPADPSPSLLQTEVTDSERKFQEELTYCIQMLETQITVNDSVTSPNEMNGVTKDLSFLRDPSVSFVKKRQLMRRKFGDYQTQMQQDIALALTQCDNVVKLQDKPTASGQVFRVHKVKENKASDNNFRFDFEIQT